MTVRSESFLVGGLALIRHNHTSDDLIKLAVTDGNPIVAEEKSLFNDLLGSTPGAKSTEGMEVFCCCT